MIRAILVVALSSFLILPLRAEDKPKSWTVDMTTSLRDESGKVIKDTWDPKRSESLDTITDGPRKGEIVDLDPLCKKCQELTLGLAVEHALKRAANEDNGRPENVDWQQRWAWSVYADEIKWKSDAKIDSLHADLIIKRLGKIGYSGDVLKQAIPLIDPNKAVPEIK